MKRRGFTLIELLVVIAIIALLVAVLLPSLASARRVGQRVTCAAQLKGFGQGASMFAQDNDDMLPGTPNGSGRYLMGQSMASGPALQRWDFMGILAKYWGIGSLPEPDGNGDGVVKDRFRQMTELKPFLCPSNKFLSVWFAGPNAGTVRMPSYNTCRYLMWHKKPLAATDPASDADVGYLGGSHNEVVPDDYKPSIHRVGNAANKVYCADGSRFSTPTESPDYDLAVNAKFGGTFSDAPPSSRLSRSWARGRAPGNNESGVDARAYAFRHSSGEPGEGAPANAYKMNMAFLDGHVDTMGDLDASNPNLWLPKGTKLQAGNAFPDVVAKFGLTSDIIIGN